MKPVVSENIRIITMYAENLNELNARLWHFEMNRKVKKIISVRPNGRTKEGFTRYEVTYESTGL